METIIAFVVIAIVASLLKKANDHAAKNGQGSAKLNRLIEEVQAKQSGLSSAPTQFEGQYTTPVAGQPLPTTSGPRQDSGPVVHFSPAPGQFQPPVNIQPSSHFQQPAQFPVPAQFAPSQFRDIASHRPPQNKLPTPRNDTDTRVRELMAAHNEVGAVRLLCDEQDMGIIEAQEYARGLVAPPGTAAPRRTDDAVVEETRYVGSAAFAESVFDTSADENVWASGWVDKPEPEDRTDMDELWQTVQNQGRPNQS